MMIKRVLTKIDDPGHGWLSVALEDIERLGLTDSISSYSYMAGNRAYLEEDVDMGRFLAAARNAGWVISIKHSYTDRASCRSYGSYNPYFVRHPLRLGCEVRLHDGSVYKVVSIDHRGRYIIDGDGGRYYLPSMSAYKYVAPINAA